jgi:hypothetical protein
MKFGGVMTAEMVADVNCQEPALKAALQKWVNVNKFKIVADFPTACVSGGQISCTEATCKATPACFATSNSAVVYSTVFAVALVALASFIF